MTLISSSLPTETIMVVCTWQVLSKYLLEERDKQFQEILVQIVYIIVEIPLYYYFYNNSPQELYLGCLRFGTLYHILI